MSTSSSTLRSFYFVVVLAIALSVPWLGRSFHTRGEPREALVAQAMLATGNWISPPAYDGAVPSKPPFSHWLIALSSLPSGKVTETTSRLPSAVAFVLFSAAFFFFVAKRASTTAALTSGLILLSSSEWFRAASTCRVDTILATSMAGALIAFYAWWERGCRGVPVIAILLTICSGLTKGPVGVVLPLGIFSLFCWLKQECRMKALPPIVLRAFGVAIPVVFVVASWYLMGYLQRGDEFLAKIRYENLERFTSSMQDEPHKHSALYLFGMLGLGLVPWTVMVVVAGLRNRPWQSLSRAALVARWKALPDLYQFSLLAAVCIVFFFCIPSSKRSVYLLPAYPFLAIWIERMIATGYERVSAVLTRLVVSVLVLAGVAWIVLMIHQIAGVSLRWESFLQSLSVLKVLSVLGVGALLTLVLRDVWRSALVSQVNALALATISAVFLISFFVYDTVAGQLSQKSWLHSSQFLSKVDLGAVDRMYSYGSEAYGASFYLQKPFARATNSLSAGSIVFVEQRRLNDLREALGSDLQEVGRYSSGLEKPSRDLVVVRTITSSVR